MNNATRPTSKRKQAILEAALACFNEHGFAGTSIDMIRERSGASVGSLYHHFGNKERIAAALYMAAMDDHHQRLQAALDVTEDAESGIRTIVRRYMDWVADNPEWARFVLNSRAHIVAGENAEALAANNRAHFSYLFEKLNHWVASGAIRPLPKPSYSAIIIGAAQDYARGWLSGRNSMDIRELREVFADAAWRALKPD